MTVGIVGLGLIGGSMAKSIKTRTAHTVFGFDISDEVMLLARLSGAIDGLLDDDTLDACDVVMLALRPQAAIDWTNAHAARISGKTILLDLCGVKRAVCGPLSEIARARGFSYIGAHPMAGKERGGFQNATADLFVGASMILTPDAQTNPFMLETLERLFTDAGFARTVYTTPDEHDRVIALTSQLAHIASSAYVKSPQAQRQRGFSAGSFKDMTRVAMLDEDMWTELFLDNADYLTDQVEMLCKHLSEYLDALRARDGEQLRALLRDGREKKATAGGN